MPTTRSSRKRTGSASSDSGLPNSLPSPRGGGGATCTSSLHEEHHFDLESETASLHLDTTLLTCCNPRGCILGPIEQPPSPTLDVIRMLCSNDKCPCSRYMHAECFESFEEQILSCLRGMSRARNWSEKQRKQNLWTKKGYDLVFKFCTCHCGKGTLRKDLNHVLPEAKPIFPSPSPSSSSTTSSSVSIASDKLKKTKRKKSSSLSLDRPSGIISTSNTFTSNSCSSSGVGGATGLTTSRRKSRCNSDSFSSDNGLNNYMQPFAHRTDYSIFDRLLPRHLVNGYHIKMEDDGYAAGDETRSFVLSSLAFHHTNTINCILCEETLLVYDRFPLIDGTFFLSPLRTHESSLEVEGKGDDPLYMSAVCLSCMAGLNTVKCCICFKLWNGTCHQIGTLYTYDLFAATPCCPSSVNCNKCATPLLDVSKLSVSFTQLSSLYDCPHCSTRDYHFLKPISKRFCVVKQQPHLPL